MAITKLVSVHIELQSVSGRRNPGTNVVTVSTGSLVRWLLKRSLVLMILLDATLGLLNNVHHMYVSILKN
jgi:hypothetical protein